MKRWIIGVATLVLAGCSKAPDGSVGEPDVAGNTNTGIAFDYSYSLALPSNRIADLQDAHARACEQLGAGRCRITGLRYSVASGGAVDANLSVKIAASLARGFGRDRVKAAEAIGATLTGADITGSDVATDAAVNASERTDVAAERARIARALARSDLSPPERAELLRQQALVDDKAHAAEAGAAGLQDRLATTPLSFVYQTGRGAGLLDRVRDAGDTALMSVGVTLTALLWIIAALGPPFLVALLVLLLWRRWGHHWWGRLLERTGRS